MRRRRSYAFSAFHNALETRLSLSTIRAGFAPAAEVVATTLPGDDPTPPPDPEPDPGPFPGEDPPIVYPPVPPSGPVGPGFRCSGSRMY